MFSGTMKGYSIVIFLLTNVILADAALNICYNIGQTSLRNNNDPELDPEVDPQPHHLDKFDIDIDHPAARLKGQLTNLSVWMEDPITSWFEHEQIFNFTYPNLTVLANYDLTGNIGDLFDIYGNGDCRIQLYNFSIAFTILNINVNLTAICTSVVVDVDVQQTPMEFHNFMDGAELQDIFNRALNSITSEIIRIVWVEARTENDPRIENIINQIINRNNTFLPFQEIVNELVTKQKVEHSVSI